jgi:hypothetical protein
MDAAPTQPKTTLSAIVDQCLKDTPPAQLTPSENERQFFDDLCTLRTELQDLQSVLQRVRKGQIKIDVYYDYIQLTRNQVKEISLRLRETLRLVKVTSAEQETMRHMVNIWEQIQVSPIFLQPAGTAELQQALHYLDLLDEQIRRIIYLSSSLIIPRQVREWIHQTAAGFFIPFHEVYGDDLPDAAERQKILKTLAQTPGLIPGGFVDVENGRIYRYSLSPWRRIFSVVILLLILLTATGAVAGIVWLSQNIPGWPTAPFNMTSMLVIWGAVLSGVVLHVLVGSAKRANTSGGLPSVLMDVLLIIDARLGEIVVKILLALVGLVGLLIVYKGQEGVTPLNAFLVGYSLDSFIELFGAGLEGTSQIVSIAK